MPSYQFDHFSGRLKESTNFQPLYPISPKPLHNYDSSTMIYDTIKTKPVTVDNSRLCSSGGASSGNRLPPRMLETMAAMQKDPNALVYLIKGKPDKILFGITCVVLFTGLGMSAAFVGRRAFFT